MLLRLREGQIESRVGFECKAKMIRSADIPGSWVELRIRQGRGEQLVRVLS